METKLIAAELATAAGVTTVVMSSLKAKTIPEIIEYDDKGLHDQVPLCTRFFSKERRLNE